MESLGLIAVILGGLLVLTLGLGLLALVILGLRFATRDLRAQWQRGRRNRASDPREWAHERGWHYQEHVDRPPLGADVALGAHGLWRQYSDLVHGTVRGVPAASWIQTEGRGPARRPVEAYRHRVVALELAGTLPRVSLVPAEDPISRSVTNRLNAGNRVVLEHARFNDAWSVTAEDPRSASAVLHPRMMERLLQPDLAPRPSLGRPGRDQVRIRLIGRHLIAWRSLRTDADQLDELFSALGDIYALLPEHLWQLHPPP